MDTFSKPDGGGVIAGEGATTTATATATALATTTATGIGSHTEDRRARELYRYFQPANPAALTASRLPAVDDVGDLISSAAAASILDVAITTSVPIAVGEAGSNSDPLISPNLALTSFAQLATLRLNTKRALISLIGREAQFILAEATRSLDISNTTRYEREGDGLWAGCSTVTQAWSVCQDTVQLHASQDSSQRELLIVDDLSQDERYKRLPFVQEDPHFRFYAGTPLTTENNINIGCLFVLDTDPRAGLTQVERDTLGALARMVMDFLRVSRQASEGRRAARLSRGLSCFVEGSSSFVDSVHSSGQSSSVCSSGGPRFSSTSPSNNVRSSVSGASRNSSLDVRSGQSQSGGDDRSVISNQPGGDTGTSADLTTPLPEWWAGNNQHHPNNKGIPTHDSHSNSWAFRRAANLLRESLELDSDGGVIFLEASNSPLSDAEAASPAPVLAISTNDEPFASQAGGSIASCPAASLDRAFLNQLLRRYPKGKLWSFHRDGTVSTSDEDEPGRNRDESSKSVRRNNKKWRASESKLFNTLFPSANQVLFVPLWNAASSQWYAGCFCWTTLETHVFSSAVELSSVLGFGTSIMAECSRVESLIADRQKGDFIGSVSHELRSPLHGILAAVEFLDGTSLNEFQESLLETINACGRTLLDTMNQVLDFSKIMSLERSWRQHKKNKDGSSSSSSSSSFSSSLEMKTADKLSAAHLDTFVSTDVSVLAEEVIEGVCLGHSFGQKSHAAVDQPVLLSPSPSSGGDDNVETLNGVDVIVDIAPGDWVYKIQPGALRRIIMNVFGNAMKYTDKGRISVRLEAVERSEGRSRRQGLEDLITLTISDTGKGISEEFLRGRIYTPFAQEDTLAVGTGLGLSIVRSIVKALDGSINIYSRPGEGTIVKVSLPLLRPVGEESPHSTPSPSEAPLASPQQQQQRKQQQQQQQQPSLPKEMAIPTHQLREGFVGKRAAILGVDPSNMDADSLWPVIAQYLTQWYGLELVSPSSQIPIDILIAEERDLTAKAKEVLATTAVTAASLPALLILCNKPIDYSAARSCWACLAQTVDIIRRPCGPHKLARSILKCLRGSGVTPSFALSSIEPPAAPEGEEKALKLPERSRLGVQPPAACDQSPSSEEQELLLLSTEGARLTTTTTTTTTVTTSSNVSEAIRSASECTASTKPSSVSSQPPPDVGAAPMGLAPSGTRAARILVVDDNSINLNLMLTFMKKRSLAALDSAENGKLAVDAVERAEQDYDMIFMDMSMPVMNGFEATRAIRALEKERHGCGSAIIIALTGLSSSRDESEALASGVDLFLTKPVSFKEVSRLIDEWESSH
ncbi:hypothetical protein ASPZODRAFT_750130 [Penicilliopsis zonata CBS 506.65]|uniref:histidine kinase n=1 Tax=Penicilliopsis zonata CBS 506.65 TaxID=1073090 RepID=A0A1L9SAQ1_9EURO|nr:hypothetical protein ASPZODRAFT_750130 [Penicilliopsis zonata CBS 506.65]OJJ44216.1 hypothetical protein ASPZODRAFT_750130 [Penicilliopsis zonata CBS 506.65]